MELQVLDKPCCGSQGNLGYTKGNDGYFYCTNCHALKRGQVKDSKKSFWKQLFKKN